MNRLSVGAAGLLLAVSLACLTTTVNADHDATADFTYDVLLEKTLDQRLFFIKTVRDIIRGDGNAVQTEFNDENSNVYSRVIFDDKLDEKLTWMVDNGKTSLINAYAKVMFNIFKRFEQNVRNNLITNENDKERKLRMDAVEKYLLEDLKYTNNSGIFNTTQPNAANMTLNIFDELASGHHEHELNQHVHTKTWDHDKWNEVYKALPGTSKYHHTGLNPTAKQHLSKALKIVDQDGYNDKKHDSEVTIATRAFNAKIEALSQSTTSAGDYFNSHKEAVDELIEHFGIENHDH